MKNFNKTQFNIEKTTLRELTSTEASAVGGGTGGALTTQACSAPCLPQPTQPTHPTNNQSATCGGGDNTTTGANTTIVNNDTADNTTWIGDFNTTNNARH